MTPQEMMVDAAALLNDQIQAVFTNEVLLPYYNMSIQKLQEIFEQNSIPVTKDTSVVLTLNSGVDRVAYFNTIPILPSNLIDILNVWESPHGIDTWTPVKQRSFIPHWLEGTLANQFLIYAWNSQEIKLLPTNAVNDLKLDYVKTILDRITISDIIIPVTITNTSLFLTNYMAGLAAYFIGENETRAQVLYGLANESLATSMGIQIKGQQSITTRRRPFRQSYKQQQIW